jgi:hypothetical protein
MLISVCALLWGCLLTSAHAQQVSIANDNNVLDISLRDADLATVLTALFNSTGGKYQVRLGSGVNGRIARLQLAQTPFDKALDAILGTDFSYTKQTQGDGTYLYNIVGRQSNTSIYTPPSRMPILEAPSIGMPTFGGDAPPPGLAAAGGSGSSSPLLSLGRGSITDSTTAVGDTAASESSVVKLIRVNYLAVDVLAEYLGGKSVDLFSLMNSAYETGYGGGGGYGGRSGGGGSRSGGGGYNNNYGNNNNNNNNNYNNNNNNNNSRSNRNNRNNRNNNQNNNQNNNRNYSY